MLLLTLMTFWHLASGFVVFFFVSRNLWILAALVTILFPAMVLMRKSTDRKWAALDILLILPGLVPAFLLASIFKPAMEDLLLAIALYAFVIVGPIVLVCTDGKHSATS